MQQFKNTAIPLRLALSLILVSRYGNFVVADVPHPIITLHDGHIGLYDGLMETQYTGDIVAGRPYTLDIYMGNTDEYDYIIDQCTYNQRQPFIDQFGCLQRSDMFVQKWETDQYSSTGGVKRTLIHLIAEESSLLFDCQIKVLECCGCAEQSCERRPVVNNYPVHMMPLTCCSPIPPPPPPIVQKVAWGHGPRPWFALIPWWLWLVLLLLLLLLLTLLVCTVGCCLLKRQKVHSDTSMKQFGKQNQQHQNLAVIPVPQPVFRQKVDKVAQTSPERRQVAQQVDFDRSNRSHLQFDDHASISLHNARMREMESRGGTGDFGRRRDRYVYGNNNNDINNRPTVFQPYGQQETRWEEEREEVVHESVFNDSTSHYENYPPPLQPESSTLRRARYIPAHQRAYDPAAQLRLQRELDERIGDYNRKPRSRSNEVFSTTEKTEEEFHERRISPDRETFREELVRTIRQSSAI